MTWSLWLKTRYLRHLRHWFPSLLISSRIGNFSGIYFLKMHSIASEEKKVKFLYFLRSCHVCVIGNSTQDWMGNRFLLHMYIPSTCSLGGRSLTTLTSRGKGRRYVLENFYISDINIPNHYPEQKVWISCLKNKKT